MALARDTTAANIKPLRGSIVQRFTLGATVSAGEICEQQSDTYMDPAVATAAVIGKLGIAIQGGSSGDQGIDFVTHGPVKCLTGATPGALVYVSDTDGEPSHTAGTKSTVIGHAISTTVLYVDPQIVDFT